MEICTDNISFANKVLLTEPRWRHYDSGDYPTTLRALVQALFSSHEIYGQSIDGNYCWKYLFISEFASSSQYDQLIHLSRNQVPLPDGILCLAGSGGGFHGLENRPWISLPGNIHLSAFLSPMRAIANFNVGFTTVSAVSVIDTIDSIGGLENMAGIKWVNDILMHDAKVCGVIAHSQTQGDTVTGVVLGIGLNVLTAPDIETTPFVPRTGCLRDFASDDHVCGQRLVLGRLIHHLDRNYRRLLSGGYYDLLNRYRNRSLIIGKKVMIQQNSTDGGRIETVEGEVIRIGDNLELYLNNIDSPIYKGRLILNG